MNGCAGVIGSTAIRSSHAATGATCLSMKGVVWVGGSVTNRRMPQEVGDPNVHEAPYGNSTPFSDIGVEDNYKGSFSETKPMGQAHNKRNVGNTERST